MEKCWFLIENKSKIVIVVLIVHCRPITNSSHNFWNITANLFQKENVTIQYHFGAGARKVFTIKIGAIDFNLELKVNKRIALA